MSKDNLPYRENVCMLIFKDKEHIFLGERLGEPGVWQLPQGGVEAEFSLEENVLREAEEELGADRKFFKIEKKLKHAHLYDFEKPRSYAEGNYRGQAQSFWLVRFLGKDSDIDLGKYQPEFQNWCWANVEQVKTKAEPKRLPGYEEALLEFENYCDSII